LFTKELDYKLFLQSSLTGSNKWSLAQHTCDNWPKSMCASAWVRAW